MKIKRLLFVAAVAVLCAGCLIVMNIRYDRLSRYPYQDPKSRELIDEYLSDADIEYIIEYSIALRPLCRIFRRNGSVFIMPRNTITWKKRFLTATMPRWQS
ncbi:MAG: hypothetical protein ACLSA6_12395 [Holdemania massiliensis]